MSEPVPLLGLDQTVPDSPERCGDCGRRCHRPTRGGLGPKCWRDRYGNSGRRWAFNVSRPVRNDEEPTLFGDPEENTMNTDTVLTKDEAIAALREAACQTTGDPDEATCGHPGCTEHAPPSRTLIHTMRGSFGADWDLDAAEAAVASAQDVFWARDMFRHDLAVMEADGRVVRFDVRGPGR